ncbi:MAG: holo-ACP synthase [Anaerolineales bacterium]|nr:holo-ACP synthase [Anaerolineales bacterium]MCB0006577.1 holo-ACP synthase [Anaerolineales bacterium]MCB0019588.1 holo-ACP synthase [Anaerolineales bacterium]
MALATGVDIIEVARVEAVLARHGERFLQRIFTARELAICGDRPERLAGRYAVKEAVSKALGTGIGDFRWQDVEILADERGKPELVLHETALELANALELTEWAISLSHTATHAIGFAVAQSGAQS